MTVQILPTRSPTLASLNPNLLHRTQARSGHNDYSTKYPFNGDFTGFADVKANLIAQLTLLDKFASAPLGIDGDLVFGGIQLALTDALKLPSRLREQVLKTFFDKLGKGLAAPSPIVARDSSRLVNNAPSSSTQLPPVAVLAQSLQDKLAPMGLRSQVLSHAIGTREQGSLQRPRWSLSFGASSFMSGKDSTNGQK